MIRKRYFNEKEKEADFKIFPPELRNTNLGRFLQAERRISPRVQCYDLLRWIPDGQHMNHRLSNLQDLSETGLRFQAAEPIYPNTILKLTLNLAKENRQIPILAKVVWSRQRKQKKGFCHVGVFFLNIDSSDLDVIRVFVSKDSPRS
ncbi:MAG: PilZ domain-containing protein [Candidatus Omnitrophica bacterium]|nr:PilZ domain-containing protein [Candidatus Omnitrophota bacterium]